VSKRKNLLYFIPKVAKRGRESPVKTNRSPEYETVITGCDYDWPGLLTAPDPHGTP